jgi:hypothetical protein
MQASVPGLTDTSNEPASTYQHYGEEATKPGTFANTVLLARRMVERGVRFIQLTCPGGAGDRWDQHSNLREGHQKNALSVDQPIAALLTDLKQRDMLRDTLVIFGTEFGRTPVAQFDNGRDHNNRGFTVWLAGGGVKQGLAYGETDEFGYHARQNRVHMHDLHATILHLMGLDHERLTFEYAGRNFRLTRLTAELPGIEHHERADYQDKLELLVRDPRHGDTAGVRVGRGAFGHAATDRRWRRCGPARRGRRRKGPSTPPRQSRRLPRRPRPGPPCRRSSPRPRTPSASSGSWTSA